MITAHDLLYKYLDYTCNWQKYNNADTPPGRVRKQQLLALLKAFGLTTDQIDPNASIHHLSEGKITQTVNRKAYHQQFSDIHYFANGEFLRDRDLELYNDLLQTAAQRVEESMPYIRDEEFTRIRPAQIHGLFNRLIIFRREVYSVTQPWGHMQEGFSVGYYYGKLLADDLQETISQHTHAIDQVLCQIIDPSGKQIVMKELIQTYNYPDVNLEEIDYQWRVEDY